MNLAHANTEPMLSYLKIKPVSRQGPAITRQCVETVQEEPKLKFTRNQM